MPCPFLVQEGIQRDRAFGTVGTFGLGDVLVDALKDVTFHAVPCDEAEARVMTESVAAYPLLTGLRSQPSADIHPP